MRGRPASNAAASCGSSRNRQTSELAGNGWPACELDILARAWDKALDNIPADDEHDREEVKAIVLTGILNAARSGSVTKTSSRNQASARWRVMRAVFSTTWFLL